MALNRMVVIFVLLLVLSSKGQEAEGMYFMDKDVVRSACYYKPPGSGPFPVMIYNQATPKPSLETGDAAPFLKLAKFYLTNGYVLFLPGRPILNPPAEVKKPSNIVSRPPPELTDKQLLAAFEGHNENIQSAVRWLKTQSFVDVNQIFMSGHSSGAIQTVLLAEKDLGIRGHIAFSPAALLWEKRPVLEEALLRAVKNQKRPIFLIQPQNDFSLHPSIILGPEVATQGKPNRAKIFPAFGRAHAEGNSFAFNAPEMWGEDVLEFMKECNKPSQ
ncbi:MAG: hypothetical protein H0X66_03375 [Verrucomicrobia bacterium]|nr:hypothetical protein [Verrucomicrobiota bacterium]